MRSALFAVAVTALAAGLVVAPATQQSAEAAIHSGLKSVAPVPAAGDMILVGKRGGGGGKGFKGGGRGFKGAHRGGSFKGYRGGGKHVYRGGGKRYAYSKNWNRHHGKNYYKGKRYAYRGRNYRGRYWYGPNIYVGGYGYGGCGWLRRQALATGSSYWWNRYYACVGYY